MRSSTGDMTKKVRNRDRPTSTWLGGACTAPSACLSSESTMTMRVNDVIISSTAGKKVSEVIKGSDGGEHQSERNEDLQKSGGRQAGVRRCRSGRQCGMRYCQKRKDTECRGSHASARKSVGAVVARCVTAAFIGAGDASARQAR